MKMIEFRKNGIETILIFIEFKYFLKISDCIEARIGFIYNSFKKILLKRFTILIIFTIDTPTPVQS